MNNDSNFSKFNLKEAFNKLDSLDRYIDDLVVPIGRSTTTYRGRGYLEITTGIPWASSGFFTLEVICYYYNSARNFKILLSGYLFGGNPAYFTSSGFGTRGFSINPVYFNDNDRLSIRIPFDDCYYNFAHAFLYCHSGIYITTVNAYKSIIFKLGTLPSTEYYHFPAIQI